MWESAFELKAPLPTTLGSRPRAGAGARRGWRSWPVPLLFVLLACRTEHSPTALTTAASGSATTTAPAAADSARTPPVESSAPTPALASSSRLAAYSASLDAAEPPPCPGYGLLLAIANEGTPSFREWLAETLRAEPLLEELLRPGGPVQFHEYLYGTRYFAPGRTNRLAHAISCSDRATCRAFAGFYARVNPWSKPTPFCNGVPASSGGNAFPLFQKTLLQRPRSHPHGTCARYRACLASEQQAPESCDGLPTAAQKCAALPTCEAALLCFKDTPRLSKRPLWPDSSPPPAPATDR